MLTCSPRVSIGSVYSHLSSLEPNEALPKAQALIAHLPLDLSLSFSVR